MIGAPGGRAGAVALAAVELVHLAALELGARHLGRFPVLGDRLRRDAGSARQFAARLASAAAVDERAADDLARGAAVYLQALLFDCREFLRQRGLRQWSADDLRALEVRALARRGAVTPERLRARMESPGPAANTVICLVQHAAFLL
jgi:hypothetical protein